MSFSKSVQDSSSLCELLPSLVDKSVGERMAKKKHDYGLIGGVHNDTYNIDLSTDTNHAIEIFNYRTETTITVFDREVAELLYLMLAEMLGMTPAETKVKLWKGEPAYLKKIFAEAT